MIVQDYENNQWLSGDPQRGLVSCMYDVCMYVCMLCFKTTLRRFRIWSIFYLDMLLFFEKAKAYFIWPSFIILSPFQFALLTKFSFSSVFMALLHSLLILLAEYNKKWHTLASFLSAAISVASVFAFVIRCSQPYYARCVVDGFSLTL